MSRSLSILLLAVVCLAVSSCADTQSQSPGSSQQVSSIPWNRPEKWEGTGMLGGFQGTQ